MKKAFKTIGKIALILFIIGVGLMGIAVCHSFFNILCTVLLLPVSELLEKIATKLIPENDVVEIIE